MTINSCLIVKNEENNIKKLIDSLLHFSYKVFITDTGSTDSTIDIIKSFSPNRVVLSHFDWINDFSAARNFNLSQCEVCDYIFWCDGDEILSDDFITQLQVFSACEQDRDSLPDVYGYGMTTLEGDIENAFNDRSSFYWRHGLFKYIKGITFINTIHETPNINGCTVDYERFGELCLVNPYDKTGEARYRNLEMFSHKQATDQLSCRDLFYIGKELEEVGQVFPAYLCFIECVYHKNWTSEGIDALQYLITSYYDYQSCSHYHISIEEITRQVLASTFYNKSALSRLAYLHYGNGSYELAIQCAETALRIKDDLYHNILFRHTYDEVFNLFTLVLCYDKLEKHDIANMYNEKILKIDPENSSAIYNNNYFKTLL